MTELTTTSPAQPQAPHGQSLGRLIGVSLGPGDPGLITRAAWAQLQRSDAVWTYPARSTKTPSYAFDIVQRAGLAPPAVHQTLLFPMTHDGDKLARAWMRAADTVLPWLQAGRTCSSWSKATPAPTPPSATWRAPCGRWTRASRRP